MSAKSNLHDKVFNPKNPGIVCTIRQVKLLRRGEPDERFAYNVLYYKHGEMSF